MEYITINAFVQKEVGLAYHGRVIEAQVSTTRKDAISLDILMAGTQMQKTDIKLIPRIGSVMLYLELRAKSFLP
jgi:hypothetical protein